MKTIVTILLLSSFVFASNTDNYPVDRATGYIKSHIGHGLAVGAPFHNVEITGDLPNKFSWVSSGFSTPVRNQGNCGSCWAFASVETMNSAAKIFLKKDMSFSQQQLVSCDTDYYGCMGGDFAGDYMVQEGLVLDSTFPYVAYKEECPNNLKQVMKAHSWANVGAEDRSPTVLEMKKALITFGPLAVSVAATMSWKTYKGGVKKQCGGRRVNHLVTLTGWDDTREAGGVWEVKNEWGSKWGKGGYIILPYGCDKIGDDAAYIVLNPKD